MEAAPLRESRLYTAALLHAGGAAHADARLRDVATGRADALGREPFTVRAEQGITFAPRLFEGLRVERMPDALFRERGRMHHVVDEPRAVVVPKVMIRVRGINANGELGRGCHGCVR